METSQPDSQKAIDRRPRPQPRSRVDVQAGMLFGGPAEIGRWFGSLSIMQKGLLLAVAVLLTSPIGVNYLLVYNGLFVGDALLFPGALAFLFLRPKSAPYRRELARGANLLLYAVLVALFGLGIIASQGDVAGAFTDFRCACLIVTFFALCKSQDNHVRQSAIYAAGVLAFTSLIAHAVFFRFFHATADVKDYYPPWALLLLAIIALYGRTPFLAMAGLLISLYVAITSFYRALMFIPLIFLLILFSRLFRPGRKTHTLSTSLFLIAMLSVSGSIVEFAKDIFHSSEGAIDQGVHKLAYIIGFFEGKELVGGDSLRAEYLSFIGSHFFAFLLPSGFDHKAIVDHWGPMWSSETLDALGANSLDGMHLFFICHFGILLSAAVCLYLGMAVTKALLRSGGGWFFAGRLSILLFVMLNSFASGAAFSLIPNSVFCGATMGCLCYRFRPQRAASLRARRGSTLKPSTAWHTKLRK